MILGVDAYRAAGPRCGVGRYLEYLLHAWAGRELAFDGVRVFSPEPLDAPPVDERFAYEPLTGRSTGVVWQARRLRPRLRYVDVLFAPYTTPPGYRGRSVVSNLGIYEGTHAETFPGWRSRARSWHFGHSARRAHAVIANSASTKNDVCSFYGVPEERVSIVWPGVDPRFRPEREGERGLARAAAARYLGKSAPYFLFVGKLSLRRNVPALLEAFAAVLADRPELRLLLVGPNPGIVDLSSEVARLGLGDSVHHIEHLDQDTLALLYRGAHAFVLPTAHEGFSFTILEALASGAPVVTLDHVPLHEGGLAEATYTIADARSETLAAALSRLADDEELRAELRRRGPRRAAAFSWETNAARTMDVLAEVARAA